MKSRVLKAYDPENADLREYVKPFSVDEDALEQELLRVRSRFTKWDKGSVINEGDMAVLRLTSAEARFNKEKVKLVVGSGMFNKEIEAFAIGMSLGGSKTVKVGEADVLIEVTDVMNRIIPELTDEMAASIGIEGVSDIESLREHLITAQKQRHFEETSYEPVNALIDIVLDNSEFVLNRADWELMVTRRIDRARELFRQEGMDIEKIPPEDFKGRIPVKSYHEFVAMEQFDGWQGLEMYLLGRMYAEEDGFAPTETDYEEFIKDYMKTWRSSEEDARRVTPLDVFIDDEYAGHAAGRLRDTVRKKYYSI